MSPQDLAIQFLLMTAVILATCKGVGIVARRAGQPQVVAEMIAGVLLGPSLLGLVVPDLAARLFPEDAMGVLFAVSQLGLAAYMFIVGLEFRGDIAGRHAHCLTAVSLAGLLVPFTLGAGLGWWFASHTRLFPEGVSPADAAIFLGAALCITAFPMLARIIHFKGLAGTTMGTVALGAGAVDDAAAWGLLALVLASFDGDPMRALAVLGMGVGYVACVLLVLRPLFAWWFRDAADRLSEAGLITALTGMVLGSWFTDWIGLHAVFGAFVMGMAMPRGVVARGLIEAIQPLTVALLLPFFFVCSGLNTQITLLDSPALWGLCGLVLLASILGKGGACALAARLTGLPLREALGVGVLMNARGLMELIILNIGLQRGIISPELFAALILMAVLTTLMASPLFDVLAPAPRPSPSD